ncbi:MAG: nucleotide pyrophosphohydrolase, partial [Nanoarchaeota archaeon]|nr:nucleotide pyrophosphohydrolase [Nanoarchaeota archaeon]
MDHKTNIQELKDTAKKFCEDRDWEKYHVAKDLAIGIITESSELLEHFRFKSNEEIEDMFKSEEKKAEISEEVADIFYFVLRLAQKYDIDLATTLKS